jgi:branched-chain amino acid transport system ATP-binding protein
VRENLQLGAYTKTGKEQIEKKLEELYTYFPVLKERTNQVAGSLSGGEQQMLAVARGLMSDPKILLMDEPSVGLSPTMTNEIGKIIHEIKEAGISIILVEQNSRMALRLSIGHTFSKSARWIWRADPPIFSTTSVWSRHILAARRAEAQPP